MTAEGRASTLSQAQLEVLAAMLRLHPGLAFLATSDGCILAANEAAVRHWSDAVAAGGRASLLFPEDTRETFGALESAVLTKGEPATFSWGQQGPAGIRSWFTSSVSPLGAGAQVIGYLCISSDVTELKRSEQRFRRSEELLVDTQGVAHLGTWEWDVTEPTAVWSAELYRIYGLTPGAYTPSYENYLKMVHPDDRERVMEATNRVFKEHVPYSHDERIFRPDGSVRFLHTWAHPVLDDGGQLIRLVGVCQDVTDRKLVEQEIQKLNADLEQRVAERTQTIENSLRDLEAFNAMASHDLRAPLGVIQGSCALILKSSEELPALVTNNLARIQRSVTHMTSLVNDLLTLAQVGHTSLARTDVDLSAICAEVIANLRRAMPMREVTVELQPGLSCRADASLIRVAVENLLGNAWKYSSRVPHARIDVGAKESNGRAAFYVRDNGAGFDMKDAHRLFAPFERLHKSTEFEGTGVGLAAVHRIIERHGGRVWADSEPGRGATFFFDLPS